MLGATNLLEAAMELTSKDSILIIAEKPEYGVYDGDCTLFIQEAARSIAKTVNLIDVDFQHGLSELPAAAAELFAVSSKVLFQARLGDTLRFDDLRSNTTVSYAYNLEILGSLFCTTQHGLMEGLLNHLTRTIATSRAWRVATGRGEILSGRAALVAPENESSMKRFPICTIPPIDCRQAEGRIQVCRWITDTGHLSYPDSSFALAEDVTVEIKDGRIQAFDGNSRDVYLLQRHYDRVGSALGIDPFIIDSWHCGIHPKCAYRRRPDTDIATWGRQVFANPRYLHIHTCGSYTPGEICLSVTDATVQFDDRVFWNSGELTFYQWPEPRALIESHGLNVDDFVRNDSIGID